MALGITSDAQGSVISVTGVFDAHAAVRLLGMLPHGEESANDVVVDFSKAREITDPGLAALVNGTRGSAVRLRARGLSQRHHRMVRLLSPGDADLLVSG